MSCRHLASRIEVTNKPRANESKANSIESIGCNFYPLFIHRILNVTSLDPFYPRISFKERRRVKEEVRMAKNEIKFYPRKR